MKTLPSFTRGLALLLPIMAATLPAKSLAGEKPVPTAATAAKPKNLRAMSKEELKKQLTPTQYHVACENGTEPAFRNEYWNNKEPGLYVDVISGEALFASVHKFDSGTGWPSFFQALKKEAVVEKRDTSHGMARVEVRSAKGDAHLGHLFNDGPAPSGQRYCVNSASLRFIPVAKLQELGYGEYLGMFQKPAPK